MEKEKSLFQNLVEDAGHTCRSYSGRGMYGKQCLGVVVTTSIGHFVADLFEQMEVVVREYEEDHISDVCEAAYSAFATMQTDSMGMDTIVYFTDVEYVDDGEVEDEEVEEEGLDDD